MMLILRFWPDHPHPWLSPDLVASQLCPHLKTRVPTSILWFQCCAVISSLFLCFSSCITLQSHQPFQVLELSVFIATNWSSQFLLHLAQILQSTSVRPLTVFSWYPLVSQSWTSIPTNVHFISVGKSAVLTRPEKATPELWLVAWQPQTGPHLCQKFCFRLVLRQSFQPFSALLNLFSNPLHGPQQMAFLSTSKKKKKKCSQPCRSFLTFFLISAIHLPASEPILSSLCLSPKEKISLLV